MNSPFPSVDILRDELSRRGVSLQVRGEKLIATPKGAAGELIPEIARYKLTLLELLNHEQDVGELARTILECRRPNGPGFDYGKLKPYWHAANELTGRTMDSSQLAAWARETA